MNFRFIRVATFVRAKFLPGEVEDPGRLVVSDSAPSASRPAHLSCLGRCP
jgi:hypothetical protein